MCGLILWAARNCFPECALGASFLCRVMSRPSKKAYMAGLHMIRWLGQNRLRCQFPPETALPQGRSHAAKCDSPRPTIAIL